MKVKTLCGHTYEGGGGKDKTLNEEWLSGLVPAIADAGFCISGH